MDKNFYSSNRARLTKMMEPGSIAVLFSGKAPKRSRDMYYAFHANRNYVYLCGIERPDLSLMVESGGDSHLYILPPDMLAERWNGIRVKPDAASDISGITDIKFKDDFRTGLDKMILSGNVSAIYLDFDKHTADEPDCDAYKLAEYIKSRYPFIILKNLLPLMRSLRTIKADCEIAAMRIAEKINGEGIIAMMKASKPGMYEYQYRAEYDYVLMKAGARPTSAPNVSIGANNFCIHYSGLSGLGSDGDFVLNDVGASWDNEGTDVSRGWPVNGKFSARQKLLYECAYNTSEYMFKTLKPGLPMADVDATIKKYNFEQLKEAGVLKSFDEIGKYMWHGGAHHVGFDVHDLTDTTKPLAPGMVFCVDIGIYHEEWGIGFRLEDNCLITETGCENLSTCSPRTVKDIEDMMRK